MTPVRFKLDNRTIPNGAVLMMGVGFESTEDEPGGDTRGRTNPKTYTYALLKAGGLWYVTGAGRVPQAAGWGAIERWLEKDGKVVEWVKVVTQTADLWPVPASPVDTSQAFA
jgi:hypothetical protein